MQSDTSRIVARGLPLLVLVVLFLVAARTLLPFAAALLWAVFVSVALFPFHERLVHWAGGRRQPASLITGLCLVLMVIVPMFVLLRAIVAFLPEFTVALLDGAWISASEPLLPEGTPPTWSALWTELRDDLAILRAMLGDSLQRALSIVLFEGRLIGSFLLEFLLGVFLATLILYNAQSLGPMAFLAFERAAGPRGEGLITGISRTIRYTVLGILGSAGAQTAVAAFAYWLVGAPHWPILAFVTFLLGLLQIGPFLVWVPLSIWLWLNGAIAMAVFMAIWGLLVVGLTDNLVKTLVVARGANLPAILVFLGALGGLLVWGIIGIFVGPVVLAVCLELALDWLKPEREEETPRLEADEPGER